MATTVGNFSAIDDSEVDAESPITETLVTRLRDNSYWIDAGTRQTTQTSTTKVLTPDGSGGVAWVEANTIAGVDGTKGAGTLGTSSGSPTSITILSSKILHISLLAPVTVTPAVASATLIIDSSDDTFTVISSNTTGSSNIVLNSSGTLTGSFLTINFGNSTATTKNLGYRKNGSSYEIYSTGAGSYNYLWL